MTNTLIIKAIRKINPNAEVTVSGGDIDTIVWYNGTQPISKSDISNMIPVVEQEIATQETNKEANKQSALNKLKSLGLNDAEIKSIIG